MATARKATAAKGKSNSKALVPANAPPARTVAASRVYGPGSGDDFVVEVAPLSSIKPYKHNPRKISETAVKKVAASLLEFGWQQVIVVDPSRVIIAGHTRLLAALSLGWTRAPIRIAATLTPGQIKAYRLADNRTAQESTWDPDYTADELRELQSFHNDTLFNALGFDKWELTRYLGAGETDSASAEWSGMPEFAQDDEMPHRRLIVNFASDRAVAKFAKAIGQVFGDKVKYIWYPAVAKDDRKARAYAATE